jgi:hypothetical protein
MDIGAYLEEFTADWRLKGRSLATAETYTMYVRHLVGARDPEAITLAEVKAWLADSVSAETARYRARGVRAFGRWAETSDGPNWAWWRQVPHWSPARWCNWG